MLAACGGSDGTADTSDAATDDGDGVLIIDESAAAADTSSSDGELVVDDSAAGAEGDAASEPAADASTSEGTDEEKALAFADCMRDEGIDWPDPTTNADGSIDPLGGLTLRDLAATGDTESIQAAGDVCGSLLDGASFLPDDAGFDADTQDSLVEFAQCLRDNGLDVDDPDFSAGAGPEALGTMFGPDFDPNDPDNSAAIDECSALFAGGPVGG